MSRAARDEFWRLASKQSEHDCWLWAGYRHEFGYGFFTVGRTRRYAHRFSYEIHHGPLRPGQHVLHRCDQPSCVNPAHLFAGDQAANVADAVAKGRHSRGSDHGIAVKAGVARAREANPDGLYAHLRGERNANAKLTAEEARIIRDSCGTSRQVAAIFGVSAGLIRDIRCGRAWAHA